MVGFFGSKKKAVPPITSENGVFHEGDIYGWPTTPGKGLTREIEYSQPLALLSSKALMQLLESQKIGTDDCLNHGELLQRALQHNLAPPLRAAAPHPARWRTGGGAGGRKGDSQRQRVAER